MTMMKSTALPDLPSELILLALKDLEAVEKMDNYRITMHSWHGVIYPIGDTKKKCAVCFAGAVMANTLKAPEDEDVIPCNYDFVTAGKLASLNEFRMGYIRSGLIAFFQEVSSEVAKYTGKDDIRVVDYEDRPDQFKKDMKQLANRLEKDGL